MNPPPSGGAVPILDGPPLTLVTGGGKGIGRAVALDMAGPGRTVILNYLNDTEAATRTQSELEEAGATVVLAQGDVADRTFRTELALRVERDLGPIGQFVHCAVHSFQTTLADLDEEGLERAIMTNGGSLPLLTHALRDSLTTGTSIIFMTSIGAQRAIPGYMALGAPKAMGESFVRYLAIELAARGVRVNTVSCSSLMTEAFLHAVPNAERRFDQMAERNPSGRNITFEEVAAAVRFLCSTQARMITGKELTVDGGLYSRL
jgi:NAD(P)-dependent dehydrogenase (short-subunit alcohol dehydrogenase family)